jgi:sugar phosphate isomerase/epimerase
MTHLELNVCFDVGHAHMRGSVESEYRLLKPRIRSTHIHDNDGKSDQHLFPAAEGGTVDWPTAMEALRQGASRYPLLLELKEVAEMAHPLENVKRVFEDLDLLTTDTE